MVGINAENLWSWLGNRRRRKKRDSSYSRIHPRSPRSIISTVQREANGEREVFKLKMGYEDDDNGDDPASKERNAFLSRVTHLHLQGKGITYIENLSSCPEVRVVFLQHNHLTRLANLRPLKMLQELYLQDNHITRIEGLKELHNLRRLLIPGNRIGVVEGLPQGLEELHIQNQRLPPGDALVLDPHALTTVQTTLRILDVSGNRLMEMGAVGLLARLRVFRAEDNDLDSLSHVTAVVSRLNHLQELYLFGNPVTAHRRYHLSMVLASPPSLEILDKKRITALSRDFIVQTECHRLAKRKRAQQRGKGPPKINSEIFTTETHFLFTTVTKIKPQEPPATGPSFVLGALRRPEFDMILSRAQRQTMRAYLASKERELDTDRLSDEEEEDWQESRNKMIDSVATPGEKGPDEDARTSDQWGDKSLVPANDIPLEKSVWFASDDDPSMDEIPRFIPRPYWRNKPPASKTKPPVTG
ncbi:protein phosphatase 1 regulatory subunit 42-like [Palaemon carinicauda]|uniref:protein phosphatase 1 regulatory subunit 42-like n=1 Tax=Palaemon carinicauda TaxID=392227 RepID=UPI0035B65CE8